MNHPGRQGPLRLAVVASHPIQYYSPWFRHISALPGLQLRVHYLWGAGVEAQYDRQFGQVICWDLPLLEGYESAFIPNRRPDPGTHHFRGLDNPELVQALAAWGPDAILLFGYAYLSHLRVLLSPCLRRIPMLLRGDSHDLSRPRNLRTHFTNLARSLLFRRFSAFLAVGKANADYYRNAGVSESLIHFAPHCVDNARFQSATAQARMEAAAWREELGIPADSLVVLFAGKFEPNKRPLDLLAAFERARTDRMHVRGPAPVLLFVGSGELEQILRAKAGNRIDREIYFAPFQNQTQMPKVYATGDLFVLPSVSESWGLAINEAMNLERPAIVSTHVGCGPDLITEGVTGWTFAAGDAEELAAVLAKAFAQGREGLARMGTLARARVSAYSFETAGAGLMSALASLVPDARWRGKD